MKQAIIFNNIELLNALMDYAERHGLLKAGQYKAEANITADKSTLIVERLNKESK